MIAVAKLYRGNRTAFALSVQLFTSRLLLGVMPALYDATIRRKLIVCRIVWPNFQSTSYECRASNIRVYTRSSHCRYFRPESKGIPRTFERKLSLILCAATRLVRI
jgi:hypothetical protein